jgi:hypothetical protein
VRPGGEGIRVRAKGADGNPPEARDRRSAGGADGKTAEGGTEEAPEARTGKPRKARQKKRRRRGRENCGRRGQKKRTETRGRRDRRSAKGADGNPPEAGQKVARGKGEARCPWTIREEPRALKGRMRTNFDQSGKLTDETAQKLIRQLLQELVNWTRKLQSV